jgi:D-alanine-D-alanine ligase
MTPDLYVPVLHGASAGRPDEADTIVAAECVQAALERLGYRSALLHMDLDGTCIENLAAERPAMVFNLVEALRGDAALAHLAPSLLEHFHLDYTGARAEAWRLTLSKITTKRLLTSAGLPTPAWSVDGTDEGLGARVIVKSITEHASHGIDSDSVVLAERAAREIGRRQARFGGRFFAEAYIEGREFNLSVLEDKGQPIVLPPAEIEFVGYPEDRPRIVDYEAKWHEGSFAYENTPRRFQFPSHDEVLLGELQDLALAAWRLFDLSGYARVDFRVDGHGRPMILEVNVNPCLSPDAGFAAAAERAGLSYDRMIGYIVEAAARPAIR